MAKTMLERVTAAATKAVREGGAMAKHRFRWSQECNGRGVCKACGLKVWISALRGPKGGRMMGYRVDGQWVAVAPKCVRAA